MSIKQESQNATQGGSITKFSFESKTLGGLTANVNVFIPDEATGSNKVPVLFYLAGLTCNEDTGAQKGAFLAEAAKKGVAIVFPDTSPRGAGIEGEDKDSDFGTGAGFYLNATADKWKGHYNMHDHIVKEIPEKLAVLPIDFSRTSIMGHSMGGHGALSLYLRNPGHYKSASGLAPICNPSKCPWGTKAFSGYLSDPTSESASYDSTALISKYPKDKKVTIKVDYGTADQFYKDGQLLPENFVQAAKEAGRGEEVDVRSREGYDHSYYFVSTFASEHVAWHAKFLKA